MLRCHSFRGLQAWGFAYGSPTGSVSPSSTIDPPTTNPSSTFGFGWSRRRQDSIPSECRKPSPMEESEAGFCLKRRAGGHLSIVSAPRPVEPQPKQHSVLGQDPTLPHHIYTIGGIPKTILDSTSDYCRFLLGRSGCAIDGCAGNLLDKDNGEMRSLSF